MKIKLDNVDRNDWLVLITTTEPKAALEDQSIQGTRWEAPRDTGIAYAVVCDHPGLVKELTAEGYELDLDGYKDHFKESETA